MKPDSSRRVFDGDLFDVVVERWGENDREIVEHPGAVAIVAVDADGLVTLVRQVREPARKELIELPAGGLEDGEAPLEAAKRELAEETGLQGGEWRELGAFWTSPGFCNERMTLFVAENVERGEASPDADEDVAIVRWPVAGIEARVGDLEDAKTIAGLLLYLRDKSARDSSASGGA